MNIDNIIKNLNKYLYEYKEYANEEINKHPETFKYYEFCQKFFTYERISKAKWIDFQEIGNNLNCYVNMPLAQKRAFGKPNHDIEHYISVFQFLLNDDIPLEERVRLFINDKKYKINYITNGKYEIVGYKFPEKYIIKNSTSDVALKVLGNLENLNFIDFNNLLNHEIKIQELYNNIVGKQTEYPINIEIDRFLYWLATETDAGKNLYNKRKIWIFAAGEGAKLWEDFYNDGIMALGWDDVGDLRRYKSQKELKAKIQKLNHNSDSDFRNRVKALWDICNTVSENDIIYVKKGNRSIVGRGIVSSIYQYDETRKGYEHYREINWTSTSEYENVRDEDFAHKALTEITNDLELCKKLENLYKNGDNMDKQPLNQILYGPPGTGKTYNTVIKAMEIIGIPEEKPAEYEVSDDTYKKLFEKLETTIKEKQEYNDKEYKILKKEFDKQLGKQIEFITFHQSYSYEEFVEGIKPYIPEWGENNVQNVNYIGKDGIFKRICNRAKNIINEKEIYHFDFDNLSIYKLWLSDPGAYDYCIENDYISLSWGKDFDCTKCTTTEEIKKIIPIDYEKRNTAISQLDIFKNWIDKDLSENKDVIVIVPGSKTSIKAIGKIVGQYEYSSEIENLSHKRKVVWLKKDINIRQDFVYNVTFQTPALCGLYKEKFKKDNFINLINNTDISKSKKCVLIIDEINRGNISKIFGELITLIEDDKRKNVIGDTLKEYNTIEVTLPYSGNTFSVPNNLYIIGTMNTSDRSIASVDIALRRRFKFVEMMPKENIIPEKVEDKINLRNIFNTLNQRICALLDRDHQIGHSYFKDVKTVTDLKDVWFDSVMPLLNEYFYGDWEKLQAILGKVGEAKDNGYSFIQRFETGDIFVDNNICDESFYCDFRGKSIYKENKIFIDALLYAFYNIVPDGEKNRNDQK